MNRKGNDATSLPYSRAELLVAVIARLLEGCRHVTVGASSPIPGAAALLQRELTRGAMRVTILGSNRYNAYTNGGVETFDMAAQGRIDAFFLGGGQIDGQGNINLVGTGTYPASEVRWPGSFGSAYLYYLVPKVILFREEHSRRVLVPKVDFISAPGVSAPGVYRPGGPYGLLTGLAWFSFDKHKQRFRLERVHPGHSVEEIRDQTGFEFDSSDKVPFTAAPEDAILALIRSRIRKEIAETYPRFASTFAH
ncbi:MAG TPA: CoA-transferase [Burkholderiales bacterium]|nr:CoA-transferase [Burkholderiales bacterium]